jgi:hypothetical protein
MSRISYESISLRVRPDLAEAHERFWRRLARPGSWWTAAERVAIGAEARHARACALCRKRKDAVSPNAVQGEHDHLGKLSAPAVDAIHRIVTDPGRLTKPWLDRLLAAGLPVEAYVELVGTVAALVSVDGFCSGIGVPRHDLPEPDLGVPSRYRPPGAILDEAWVPMIPRSGANGTEADLWSGGFVPNVQRALSLVPDEVRTLKDLSRAHYLDVANVADPTAGGRSLSRPQMELIAARVSVLNQCFY